MGLVAKGQYSGYAVYTKYMGGTERLMIAPAEKRTTSTDLHLVAYITSQSFKSYELLSGSDVVVAGAYSVKLVWKSGLESVVTLSQYEYTTLLKSFNYIGSSESYNKDVKSTENFDWAWKIGGIVLAAAYCLFYIFGGDW